MKRVLMISMVFILVLFSFNCAKSESVARVDDEVTSLLIQCSTPVQAARFIDGYIPDRLSNEVFGDGIYIRYGNAAVDYVSEDDNDIYPYQTNDYSGPVEFIISSDNSKLELFSIHIGDTKSSVVDKLQERAFCFDEIDDQYINAHRIIDVGLYCEQCQKPWSQSLPIKYAWNVVWRCQYFFEDSILTEIHFGIDPLIPVT